MTACARDVTTGFLIAVLLAANGCGKPERSTNAQQSKISSGTTDIDQALPPKERALKAQKALSGRLSSQLLAAMANGGPSAAIEVCSQKAAKIAAEVGQEYGVSIGRTSFKLRNPQNRPPEWAATFVKRRVAEPQFVELDDQTTGVLLPIHLSAQCLVCHGPTDQIADDVMRQLAQRYPDDQATRSRMVICVAGSG